MVCKRVKYAPAALALLCLLALPASGTAQDDQVGAYRIRTDSGEEVRLDGLLSEDLWSRAVALSGFSALRVGGNADLFFEPAKPVHFSALLSALQEDNRDYFILGGGANVCLPDEGLRIVIHTGAMRRMFREDDCIRVWPGVTIQQLVRAAGELGLSGMQKLVGVPGNLGGAIAMNAGSAEWGIWELVEEVTLWTAEGLGAFTPAEIQPEYRNGNLGEEQSLAVGLM